MINVLCIYICITCWGSKYEGSEETEYDEHVPVTLLAITCSHIWLQVQTTITLNRYPVTLRFHCSLVISSRLIKAGHSRGHQPRAITHTFTPNTETISITHRWWLQISGILRFYQPSLANGRVLGWGGPFSRRWLRGAQSCAWTLTCTPLWL